MVDSLTVSFLPLYLLIQYRNGENEKLDKGTVNERYQGIYKCPTAVFKAIKGIPPRGKPRGIKPYIASSLGRHE